MASSLTRRDLPAGQWLRPGLGLDAFGGDLAEDVKEEAAPIGRGVEVGSTFADAAEEPEAGSVGADRVEPVFGGRPEAECDDSRVVPPENDPLAVWHDNGF